jgi:hypothetical protein
VPVAEVCDAFDNDCDAVVDEGLDTDNDSVLGCSVDKCLGTVPDTAAVNGTTPTIALGENRHVWYGGSDFKTLVPVGKKGAKAVVNSTFNITDTYGCSCEQILDVLVEKTGGDFGGHYKYGCSKSVVEAWIAGEYNVGETFVETVEVPATSAVATDSVASLEVGKNYILNAYGTALACNVPGCVIEFDADYSTSDNATWVDGVAAPYDGLGPDLLDLMVDGGFVNWGAYSATHEYQISHPGTGAPLSLLVNDLDYPSNSGSLFVDIVWDGWVDLW